MARPIAPVQSFLIKVISPYQSDFSCGFRAYQSRFTITLSPSEASMKTPQKPETVARASWIAFQNERKRTMSDTWLAVAGSAPAPVVCLTLGDFRGVIFRDFSESRVEFPDGRGSGKEPQTGSNNRHRGVRDVEQLLAWAGYKS
jgi:hypothetical protein